MDIGAVCHGKGKRNKGKGFGGYGNNCYYNNYKGKCKRYSPPDGQGSRFKGQQGCSKGKGYNNKGKGEGYYNNQQEEKDERKTCDKCLLQMWTARTHGQTMQSGDLQLSTLTLTAKQMTGKARRAVPVLWLTAVPLHMYARHGLQHHFHYSNSGGVSDRHCAALEMHGPTKM